MNPIKIGTRGSKLALWQAQLVADTLKAKRPNLTFQIIPLKTTGDKIINTSLSKIGGKALFLKEIEDELLNKNIDLAVHSMKDIPADLPPGLEISAILARSDPRDVLVAGCLLKDMPPGSVLGTSSLRRQVQIRRKYPDLRLKDLRGNLDTRIQKLKKNLYDGIIIAAAGMVRLGLSDQITEYLDMIPAVGQGAIGVEIREGSEMRQLTNLLDHPETNELIVLERLFQKKMGGGCQLPMGCQAKKEKGIYTIRCFLSDVSGKKYFEKGFSVFTRVEEKLEMAMEEILSAGGQEVLEDLKPAD